MTKKNIAGIYIRGFLIGTADLVPGVSGGTVAFLSGIYSRLLNALGTFSKILFWQNLKNFEIKKAWQQCDAFFLLILLIGILSAVLTLSTVLHYLLTNQTHLLLGFFFGLVVASMITITMTLKNIINSKNCLLALAACLITLWFVSAPVSNIEFSYLGIFLGGALAICAMILPGISGSYILLIIGLYPTIIEAIYNRDLLLLFIFAFGCGGGLLLFSRLLSFALARWHNTIISILIGIMAGALPKLWPWKEGSANLKVILQSNVLPHHFEQPQVIWVCLLAIIGAGVVYGLYRLQNKDIFSSSL